MKIICLIALIFGTNAHALSIDNSLQLSKARIEALKSNFSSLAYNCFMFAEDCQIESNAQSATLKWLSSERRDHSPLVQYDRGVDKFFIDGAVRIAKTGSIWGSPVIFNEDLLSLDAGAGNYKALGFFEAIGVLIHEFGHHQEPMLRRAGLSVLDHHELDLIAAKTVTYLKDRSRKISITAEEVPGLQEDYEVAVYQLEIESYNGTRNIWSQIYVDGLAETKEVSSLLFKNIKCPVVRNNGHIVFKGEAYSASFRKLQAPTYNLENGKLVMSQLVGSASMLCVDKIMGQYHVFNGYSGKLELHFAVETANKKNKLRFLESSNFTADEK